MENAQDEAEVRAALERLKRAQAQWDASIRALHQAREDPTHAETDDANAKRALDAARVALRTAGAELARARGLRPL